jgi:hypothetical protein
MDGQPTNLPPAADPGSPVEARPRADVQQQIYAIARSWKFGTIAGAVMLLLALVGVGLTTSRSDIAQTYWIWLVPIYGLLCIGTAAARGWHEKGWRQLQLFRQIAHWLGIGVALWLDFLIRRSGEETATAAGLNAMMLLALGCYLAGVHLEWRFAVVGLVLTVGMITVAKATEYSWMIFVVGVLAIVVLLGWRWLLARWRSRKASP